MVSLLIAGGSIKTRGEKAKAIIAEKKEKAAVFDTLALDFEATIGIAEIRHLSRWLSLKSYGGGLKIAVIGRAENLTIEAQNAFLKTLEEPPPNSLIILSSPRADLLLPTIISRCHLIDLGQATTSSSVEELSQNLNVSFSLLSGKIGERFKILEDLGINKDRELAKNWLGTQELTWREILLINLGVKENPHKISRIPTDVILAILKNLSQSRRYLEANVDPRLVLENLILSFP